LPIIGDLIRKEAAMRALVAFATLAILTAPAAGAAPENEPEYQIPSELTDPAMAANLGKMLGAAMRAMMDVPVGEMQAAVEGRAPTAADKRRTVRDLAGRDPNFDSKLEAQVVQAMPRMQAGMKAMTGSLPGMMKALEKAAEQMEGSIDRATANVPQPGYPKQ
jgi:hypothetical protein